MHGISMKFDKDRREKITRLGLRSLPLPMFSAGPELYDLVFLAGAHFGPRLFQGNSPTSTAPSTVTHGASPSSAPQTTTKSPEPAQKRESAVDRQFDLDFPNDRGRGSIGVQGLPVDVDGFLGAGNQVFNGTPGDQNRWEFWYVTTIAGTVPFDDQRVLSHHLISLLDTDRKSTRLNSSHRCISYAVFCLKKNIYALTCRLIINKSLSRSPFQSNRRYLNSTLFFFN